MERLCRRHGRSTCAWGRGATSGCGKRLTWTCPESVQCAPQKCRSEQRASVLWMSYSPGAAWS
eukprot:2092498-Alexandrium_andersonii.AAC.1